MNPTFCRLNFFRWQGSTSGGLALTPALAGIPFDRRGDRLLNSSIIGGNVYYSSNSNNFNTINNSLWTLIVKNCNWKDFKLYRFSSSTLWPSASYTNNTNSNLYIHLPIPGGNPVLPRVYVTATIDGGDNAYASEVILTQRIFTMADGTAGELIRKPSVSSNLVEYSSDTTGKVYIADTMNYEINLKMVSQAERLNYKNIYEYNKTEPFVFVPEPQEGINPAIPFNGEFSHQNWTNPFEFYEFTENLEANGFNGKIELKQAGGLI